MRGRNRCGTGLFKKKLSLEGRAEEIFIRANHIIEEMIVEILETNPQPEPQKGDVVRFTRRKPEDGNWDSAGSIDEVYDYIRMLDAEGYPPAFVRVGNYKLEFSKASRKVNAVNASVRIIKEKEND
jgi:methionyl-tRNA formyltransferase